jgi:hypothetical protein
LSARLRVDEEAEAAAATARTEHRPAGASFSTFGLRRDEEANLQRVRVDRV